jgi:hypothetical protein
MVGPPHRRSDGRTAPSSVGSMRSDANHLQRHDMKFSLAMSTMYTSRYNALGRTSFRHIWKAETIVCQRHLRAKADSQIPPGRRWCPAGRQIRHHQALKWVDEHQAFAFGREGYRGTQKSRTDLNSSDFGRPANFRGACRFGGADGDLAADRRVIK